MRALFKTVGILFLSHLSMMGADWPQWRGPHREGHAASGETVSIEKLQSPKALWRIPVGGGFSSPIIQQGKVYLFDEKDGHEVARALQLADGEEVWTTPFANAFGDEWGSGPRSTPFVDENHLYGHSCNGEFRAFAIKTGKVIWGFNFEDFGVKFLGSKAREGTASRRGNNGSGLIDGDAVIVPVGAANGATLVCLNKDNGKLIWKTGTDEAAYSSLMTAPLAGARQVIAYTADALLGADRITGKILWRVPLKTNAKRHTGTPVVVGNTVIVNSHTFGLACFEISREGSEFKATERWRNPDLKINLATPIVVGSHLYSHGPARDFICASVIDGKTVWTAPGFGKDNSSTIAAGETLLVLTDAGELIVAPAEPQKYSEKLRLQIAGKNWNHPALADGMLLVRDQRELACYPVR